ncbi:MAG: ribose-phosphate pyrophosphokinase [bacterium]|nr:ribose-phosphate pyrophosphokinase [bacterium]
MKNIKLFSGTANLPLAQKVAQELGVELGKVEVIRFADTESRVWVNDDIKGKNVVLIQSICPPVDQNLVEFLLLADALSRGKPKKLIAVVPYFGYARQDKIFREGEALSSQMVARLIELAGFEKLITIHLHSLNILNFFKIPVVHLPTASVFAQALTSLKGASDWIITAPDQVAQGCVAELAKILKLTTAFLEKTRDYSQKDKPKTTGLVGKVKGKNVLMFDDLSSTGGTIVGGAKMLKENGAKKIYVALSHMVVEAAADRIIQEKSIAKLFVTDTIPQLPKKKLKVVSVAPLIARAITNSV